MIHIEDIIVWKIEYRSQPVPPIPRSRGAEGKRETGARPVRSRHCMRFDDAMRKRSLRNREGGAVISREPGNLPAAGTGKKFPISRGLDCTVSSAPARRAQSVVKLSFCLLAKGFFVLRVYFLPVPLNRDDVIFYIYIRARHTPRLT